MKKSNFKFVLLLFVMSIAGGLSSQTTDVPCQGCPPSGPAVGVNDPETAASDPCIPQATSWYLGGNNITPVPSPPASGGAVQAPTPNHTDIGTCNDFPFILKANNNHSLWILQNGKVGIGTPAPNARLEVVDPNQSLIFARSQNVGGTSALWSINANTSYGLVNDASDIGHIRQNYVNPVNMINFQAEPSNFTGASVWIGTRQTSGSHTDADFTVGGKILAQQIYVTIQGSWADYVFSSDYKLPSLLEVESFYKKNKHLPEIPSAKEVEEKGINVAEMNKLLLQKVEELTLYMVEQQKEIEKLKEKVK